MTSRAAPSAHARVVRRRAQPLLRVQPVVERFDRQVLGERRLHFGHRRLAPGRRRLQVRGRDEARGLRTRHPVLHDPALIFGMNRGQRRVISQHGFQAIALQQAQDALVHVSQLIARDVTFPHHRHTRHRIVDLHRAHRVVREAGQQLQAIEGVTSQLADELVVNIGLSIHPAHLTSSDGALP